jgi:tetratricopeptide (TPR) repeat protein
MRWSLSLFIVAAWASSAGIISVAWAAPPKPPASDVPLAPPEARPEPLQPKADRTEAERDRVTAAALFTEGRLLLDRQDKLGALRKFERAWRYDPSHQALLREIVDLALDSRRLDEAIRYALLTPDLQGKDALLLRRLALQLSERGKWQEALQMFEASAGKRPAEDIEPTDLSSALLLLEIARLRFLTGQYERSAAAFARVRVSLEQPDKHGLTEEGVKTLLGTSEQTWSLMAEAALAAKQFNEAEELCRKANDAKPNEGQLAFRLARIAAAQDKSAEALKLLEEAFEKGFAATSREPFELLQKLLEKTTADAELAKRQYLERLKALRDKQESSAPVAFAYAQALVQANDLPAAEAVLTELLDKQPSEVGYRQLAEIQYREEKWEALAATLGRAVAKSSSLEPLGEVAKSLVEDEAALPSLLAVAEQQREQKTPSPRGQALALGLLAARAKQFDAAEKELNQALEEPQANKTQIWLAWGLELFFGQEPGRAAEVLQRIIEERAFPTNELPLYYYLSAAYELAGQTPAALRALKQGIARNPNIARLEGRLGWVQFHAKNYPAAETAYREFLERFEKSADGETRGQLRQARLVLSNVYLKLDRFPESVECLEEVLDEFPGDVSALNDLGYLWAERGQHLHRALAMTHEAVAAEPNNRAYRDSLGWAYYQLERYDEAARELRLAADDEAADGVVLDHLGDAEARLGRSAAAAAAWQRAAAAYEQDGETEKGARVKAKLQVPSSE